MGIIRDAIDNFDGVKLTVEASINEWMEERHRVLVVRTCSWGVGLKMKGSRFTCTGRFAGHCLSAGQPKQDLKSDGLLTHAVARDNSGCKILCPL